MTTTKRQEEGTRSRSVKRRGGEGKEKHSDSDSSTHARAALPAHRLIISLSSPFALLALAPPISFFFPWLLLIPYLVLSFFLLQQRSTRSSARAREGDLKE